MSVFIETLFFAAMQIPAQGGSLQIFADSPPPAREVEITTVSMCSVGDVAVNYATVASSSLVKGLTFGGKSADAETIAGINRDIAARQISSIRWWRCPGPDKSGSSIRITFEVAVPHAPHAYYLRAYTFYEDGRIELCAMTCESEAY